jgi:hypothetical protein
MEEKQLNDGVGDILVSVRETSGMLDSFFGAVIGASDSVLV